jgi:dethiobiotin synthetase
MDKHRLFITATSTGVGKTLVSGLLLNFLRGQGINAGYQKWVATGGSETVEDLERVMALAGGGREEELDLQVVYRLGLAASPHLAAERAGTEIAPEPIIAAYEKLAKRYEVLLVEGAGGLLVPLSRRLLLADLVARLQMPALLVARSGLGTLNHTLLSLEALRSRNIPLLGVLLTDDPDEDETIAADNLRTIAEIGRARVFGRLPRCGNDGELFAAFRPLGEAILAALAPGRAPLAKSLPFGVR